MPGRRFWHTVAHQPATPMKTLARLLVLALATHLAVAAVSASEHHEPARINFTVAKSSILTSRLATAAKSIAHINVTERLVLTPRLAKGGASVRLNLVF